MNSITIKCDFPIIINNNDGKIIINCNNYTIDVDTDIEDISKMLENLHLDTDIKDISKMLENLHL